MIFEKNNRVAREGGLGSSSRGLQPDGAGHQRAKALGYVYEGRLRGLIPGLIRKDHKAARHAFISEIPEDNRRG